MEALEVLKQAYTLAVEFYTNRLRYSKMDEETHSFEIHIKPLYFQLEVMGKELNSAFENLIDCIKKDIPDFPQDVKLCISFHGLDVPNPNYKNAYIYFSDNEKIIHPILPILTAIQSKGKVSYFDIINNKL